MDELRIPETEIEKRQSKLLESGTERGCDGVLLFGFNNLQYFGNFYNMPTQRPVVLALTEGKTVLIVPQQDVIHAERTDDFVYDELRSYYEYPQSDPMSLVSDVCGELDVASGTIGVDSDGPARQLGYYGPSLSDVVGAEIVSLESEISSMQRRKSEAELDLYREGMRWSTLAHRILHDRIEPGAYPIELGQAAQTETIRAMLDALGDRYRMTTLDTPVGVKVTSGEGTAYSHNLDQATRFAEGELIETFVMVSIDNYKTGKLERTMVLGEPSAEQRHHFEITLEAHERLIETIKSGVEYAYAEELVTDYFAEHGLADAQDHRPGHGMGLSWLDMPLLDRGLEGTFSEGEVFTIEPAIYVPGIGGFRHCDTVAATSDGIELLTNYPRDLESLTIPVE